MSNYQGMIHRITDTICGQLAERHNYILVGDNSSGKSEVLLKVVEHEIDQAVYFIDSVNRTFDAHKVELVSKAYKSLNFDSKDVVDYRINPFNFNLQDTFHAATCIEQLFDKYSGELRGMCKSFLQKDIRIDRENLEAGLAENKVRVDGNEVQLSSGYQAVLRLFSEVLFFRDAMQLRGWSNGVVVIDEIDEYLSPKYSAEILNFLQEQFPVMSFLVTTHSLDVVRCTQNANLLILHELSYEIYTSQELKSTVSAEDIFVRLFFSGDIIHRSDDDFVDERLRVLLNLKIAGVWDEKAENELKWIQCRKLQPHQKMICKQIEEW